MAGASDQGGGFLHSIPQMLLTVITCDGGIARRERPFIRENLACLY